MVTREVLLLLGLGLAVGIPAALGLDRFISAQLYGVKENNPWIAGIAVILLSLIAAIAGLVPARWAASSTRFSRCVTNDLRISGDTADLVGEWRLFG